MARRKMLVPIPTTDVTDFGNQPGQGGPLRAGGKPAPASLTSARDLPSTRSVASERQQPALTIVRDLWAGNEKIHDAATTYLPQNPGERATNYRIRLARAVLFNVFKHTINGLVGFVFRTDPTLGEDVPKLIVEHAENIDLAGTHLSVFARDIAADAACAGHAAILVDYPNVGTVRLNREEEAPIRPYWVPLRKDDLLSWRTTVEQGRTILTQLVIRETHLVPDGAFIEREETRYRVFFRAGGVVGWRLLGISANKQVFVVDAGLIPTQDEIPVSEIPTSGKVALFESQPPFLDLAYLNLAHYRQWSDYDTSIHMTCVPILFTAGVTMTDAQGQPIEVGPNAGLNSPDPNATAMYVTHDGGALSSCKASLDDLENRMAALGLAAMATSKRVAETATAKEIDKGASDSALAVTARGLQDGLERALGFHAKYLRLPSGGSIEVNTDFENMVMDAPTMTAWASLATALNIPVRVVLEALIEGGRLPEDTDVEALEVEIEANAAAKEEQERQRIQDQQNALENNQPAARPQPKEKAV